MTFIKYEVQISQTYKFAKHPGFLNSPNSVHVIGERDVDSNVILLRHPGNESLNCYAKHCIISATCSLHQSERETLILHEMSVQIKFGARIISNTVVLVTTRYEGGNRRVTNRNIYYVEKNHNLARGKNLRCIIGFRELGPLQAVVKPSVQFTTVVIWFKS